MRSKITILSIVLLILLPAFIDVFAFDTHEGLGEIPESLVEVVVWRCPGDTFHMPSMSIQKYSNKEDGQVTRFTFNRIYYSKTNLSLIQVANPSAEFKWNGSVWDITVNRNRLAVPLSWENFSAQYPTACHLPNNVAFVY